MKKSLGFLLMALALGGCRTFEGRRAIVPILEIYSEEGKPYGKGKISRADLEAGATRNTEVVLRPLGSYTMIGEERHRLRGAWPLFDLSWGADEVHSWLLPFLYYRDRPVPRLDDSDIDFMLFPFIYAGYEPEAGPYFGLFPVGGTLKNLVAKDRIDFFLFPLLWRAREGDEVSLHVLWPFFNHQGGGRREGWRLWPFYGEYDAVDVDGDPRHRKRFVLWPFYIRQQNRLNSLNPQDVFLTFPLYGYSEGPNNLNETYLWPFYSAHRDKRTRELYLAGFLFPYRFQKSQRDYWPFFGWKETTGGVGPSGYLDVLSPFNLGGDEESEETSPKTYRLRQFALWPLQRFEEERDEVSHTTRFWLLPLMWRFHREDAEGETAMSELKVWPLFRHRRDGEETSFYAPSPIFFREEATWERQYARLWRLFLHRDTPEWSGWELLYGLLSHRVEKDPDTGESEADAIAILYGLLEWNTDAEGHGFRLLYLPWK